MTALATLALDAPAAYARALVLDGATATSARRAAACSGDCAMIFRIRDELNPSFSVAWQMMEAFGMHEGGSRRRDGARVELLKAVEIRCERGSAYPPSLRAA